MRDFACCGQTLPTLHDLLQHYEESHAQQTPQSLRGSSAAQRARENSTPSSKAALAIQAATAVHQQSQQQNLQEPRPQNLQMPQNLNMGGIQQQLRQQQSQPSTPVQKNVQPVVDDMDGVEDMEMDDAIGPMDQAPDTPIQQNHQPVQAAQQSLFGQQPRPTLNLNSSGLQHSGLRTSQPATPATSGFGFQNNPTVSSVNTPTLSAQPIQQQQTFSPDTSVPGTPAGEMEDDFSNMPMNMGMGMGNMGGLNMANMNFNYGGFAGNDLGLDLCIDEPAKRLYSPNGGFQNQRALQQQFAQFGLGQGQYGNNNTEAMREAFRQQQQLMALNGMTNQQAAVAMMMAGEEHKPFRCPVIGCEKAYKNQNGLKYVSHVTKSGQILTCERYHKTHGHQTQQLHENGDGTFSIVNPETSAPYPGTLGMEKEKPYKCEVCGKRYKNLNGLKYVSINLG
jgi:transcription factor SFP1